MNQLSISNSPTLTSERESQHAHEQADKAARNVLVKCCLCGKWRNAGRGMEQHRVMYHRKRLAKMEGAA